MHGPTRDKDQLSPEREEELKRQEAEMRTIFGLPPERVLAELRPKAAPKR